MIGRYYHTAITFSLFFLFSLFVSSTFASADFPCDWCRREGAAPDGTPVQNVCYACSNAEYLCSPDVSVTATCSYFTLLNHNVLEAFCKDSSNVVQSAQLSLDSIIGNIDGVLTLGSKDFSKSCFDIQLIASSNDLVLSAECGDSTGYYRAGPDLNFSSVLANLDGVLTLTASLSASMPPQPDFSTSLNTCSPGISCGAGFIRGATNGSACIRCDTPGFVAKPGQYCNGFSVVALPCPVGYYCVGSDQPKVSCESDCLCGVGSFLSCPQPCPNGRLCVNATVSAVCPRQHYCQNNAVVPCPANTYGAEYGLGDDSCSGKCGVIWSSASGSAVCNDFSPGGIVLITFIIALCTTIFITGSANLYKLRVIFTLSRIAASPSSGILADAPNDDANNNRAAENAAAADARTDKQMQIKAGVAALVTKVNNQIFSSIFNLPSSMIQQKMAQVHQVESRIIFARQKFTDHLFTALLAHPPLHFDDETYPRYLPAWAEREPGSLDGEGELDLVALALSRDLADSVEKDILRYVGKLLEEMENQLPEQQQQPGVEQPLQGDALNPIPSPHTESLSWHAVDGALEIALPLAMSVASQSAFCESLRVPYGHTSLLQNKLPTFELVCSLFSILFDLLVIVACIVCMSGETLLNIRLDLNDATNAAALFEFLSSSNEVGFKLNWYDFSSIGFEFRYFDDGEQNGRTMFQPVLDQCVEVYGRLYFALHALALVLYCIIFFAGSISACIGDLRPSGKCCWSRRPKIVAVIRTVGLCALIAAIAVYQVGCITRLDRLPKFARVPFPYAFSTSNPYWMTPIPIDDTSSFPPIASLNAAIVQQPAFNLSIAALVGAFLSTFWAFQTIHPAPPQKRSVLPPPPPPPPSSAAAAARGDNMEQIARVPVAVPQPQLDLRVVPLAASITQHEGVQQQPGAAGFVHFPSPYYPQHFHYPQAQYTFNAAAAPPPGGPMPGTTPSVQFHL